MERLPLERPVDTIVPTTNDKLRNEYLRAVLRPGVHYAVDQRVDDILDDGTRGPVERRTFFQVISVWTGNSREHTMHTVLSADDIQLRAPLVIEVQMLERWTAPESAGGDDGRVRVYGESDPEWIVPERIAPFAALGHSLVKFRRVETEPDRHAIVVLL